MLPRTAEGLLVVGVDEALDELLHGAGLGQIPLGQLVGQLGLGQALVRLARLLLGPLGLRALGGLGRLLLIALGRTMLRNPRLRANLSKMTREA